MRMVTLTCEHCLKQFEVPAHLFNKPTYKGRFCSRACHFKDLNTPERNAAISRATADQRSQTLRDKTPRVKGYRKLHGRHEHVVVMEQKLGRALRKWEVVHHKDEDTNNNNPDNLEVMTRAQHALHHFHGKGVMQ